jgi:hypothetical protein
LVHIGSPRHPICVTVVWQAGHKATWEFRGGSLPGSCELKSITLEGQQKVWALADDGDGTWQGLVPGVGGLLPSVDERRWADEVDCTRHVFKLEVQWLQGIRAAVPRVEKVLASPPGALSTRGQGVARFLYQWDRLARSDNESRALEYVLSFFRALGFELRATDVAPGFFRLDVAPLANPSASINLVDTGEGLTQVLAPLVASIADAAAAGAQVLIETHSEVLLAAIQLAVAQRPSRIANSEVALYWVEKRGDSVSVAKRAPLDEHGRVGGGWPIDAFSDLLKLKGELLNAQRGAM